MVHLKLTLIEMFIHLLKNYLNGFSKVKDCLRNLLEVVNNLKLELLLRLIRCMEWQINWPSCINIRIGCMVFSRGRILDSLRLSRFLLHLIIWLFSGEIYGKIKLNSSRQTAT